MNPHLERGLLLYQQNRHAMAEQELRLALAQEPDDAHAHALLALCLAENKKFKDATDEARQAVQLAPDYDFAHYAAAKVAYARDHCSDALRAIEEAIRLDPTAPDYRALLAAIHFDQSRWKEALAAAEAGLEQDAEHVGCANLRAMALVKLGRRAEAGRTIDATLARNPDNSSTHANQGWTYLEANNPQKALEHFREALRLDPENEWARQGIVEALKARHFIYALMLRYFLWMAKLSPQAQFGIIIGGWFGNRILGSIARSNPELAPWILPIRILYIVFAILTWTADPLFNLLLRLNRFGRLALSREQIVASNWLGLALLIALVSLTAWLVNTTGEHWLVAALVFGLLCLPVAGAFKCRAGWPRRVGIAVTLGLLGMGGMAVLNMFIAVNGPEQFARAGANAAMGWLGMFALGVFLSGWLFNFLALSRGRG
jgi:tetratricopeptide (TPR) repeat protein